MWNGSGENAKKGRKKDAKVTRTVWEHSRRGRAKKHPLISRATAPNQSVLMLRCAFFKVVTRLSNLVGLSIGNWGEKGNG